MQAAARFEPEREVRFSTYANWWIRSAIQDYVLRNWSIVRTGTTAAQKSLFFNLRRLRAKIQQASEILSPEEQRKQIAVELGVPLKDVEAMEQRMSGADQSLNSPIGESGEDEWLEMLSDERPTPEAIVTGMRDAETRSKWLKDALSELSPREQTIIERRRLVEDGATLEELGTVLGVSKERVRQLEHRAMLKLKQHISRNVDRSSDLYSEV